MRKLVLWQSQRLQLLNFVFADSTHPHPCPSPAASASFTSNFLGRERGRGEGAWNLHDNDSKEIANPLVPHYLILMNKPFAKTLSRFSDKRIIAFIVSLAIFMDALDTTIINTAIPAMSRSLQVNPVDLKIALISYLLSLAVFIPISGWIADKYGTKRVFNTAIGIFTLSSIFCGSAQNLTELVIARSCQGLGGALMLPLGRLLILRTFQRHELVEAMNAVIMVVSLGLMLGPVAGGFITDHFSWHWIFWVNIPVGLFAILMASFWLADTAPIKVRRFDFPGFVMFGGGLATLSFAMSDLSETTANQKNAFMILALAICMLVAYFIYARKQTHPIINTSLFQFRTFKISITANLFARLGFGGVPFLLPLLLQVGLGYSAQLSGFLLVPMAVGILIIKSFNLNILRFFGYKNYYCSTPLVGILLLNFASLTRTHHFMLSPA